MTLVQLQLLTPYFIAKVKLPLVRQKLHYTFYSLEKVFLKSTPFPLLSYHHKQRFTTWYRTNENDLLITLCSKQTSCAFFCLREKKSCTFSKFFKLYLSSKSKLSSTRNGSQRSVNHVIFNVRCKTAAVLPKNPLLK